MADQGNQIVSNATYDLLAVLLTKLEGLEAYDEYMEDLDGEQAQLIEQIRKDDERHASMLRDAVEKMIKQKGLR